MANTLEIKKISTASVSAADICRVLDEANIGFVAVDNHCWAEAFPYRPTMEVRMAHNGKQLLINYRVTLRSACVQWLRMTTATFGKIRAANSSSRP